MRCAWWCWRVSADSCSRRSRWQSSRRPILHRRGSSDRVRWVVRSMATSRSWPSSQVPSKPASPWRVMPGCEITMHRCRLGADTGGTGDTCTPQPAQTFERWRTAERSSDPPFQGPPNPRLCTVVPFRTRFVFGRPRIGRLGPPSPWCRTLVPPVASTDRRPVDSVPGCSATRVFVGPMSANEWHARPPGRAGLH